MCSSQTCAVVTKHYNETCVRSHDRQEKLSPPLPVTALADRTITATGYGVVVVETAAARPQYTHTQLCGNSWKSNADELKRKQ